jgi:hypothetical protein
LDSGREGGDGRRDERETPETFGGEQIVAVIVEVGGRMQRQAADDAAGVFFEVVSNSG